MVAAGVGIAKLLGEPAATSRLVETAGAAWKSPWAGPPAANGSASGPNRPGGVRLVPDFARANSDSRSASFPLVEAAPPLWTATSPPAALAPAPSDARDAELSATNRAAPRARLRNEAPRPLLTDPRSSRPASAAPFTITAIAEEPESPSTAVQSPWWSDPPAVASRDTAPAPPPTIAASYNAAPEGGITTPIAPRLYAAEENDNQPRTHVVVDGDSLARLAGRYLDDPRRGGEIFEANRGLLHDPELLPIGTELVIPDKGSGSVIAPSPQSFVPPAIAIHAPAGHRLVPVRPVPASALAPPRAELLRPRPVD
jgi:hypothetical protein